MYPNESFLNIPPHPVFHGKSYCGCDCRDPSASRYWRVVDVDYRLQPGFEP